MFFILVVLPSGQFICAALADIIISSNGFCFVYSFFL